jgi:hypothetical protein
MKRSYLKRPTPLRRVSKKRAKLMREVKEWQKDYVEEMGVCAVCDRDREELETIGSVITRYFGAGLNVHEIAKGPHRAEALKHRACCLVVCNQCNCCQLCDYSVWPIERQLALKLLTDPQHFDLDLFNKVRGRAPTAITLLDLVPYLTLKS